MLNLKKIFLFAALLPLVSCGRSHIHVRREWVDGSYLASTHVGTPDPRQSRPPFGQQLVIYYWVPSNILSRNPQLVLNVIYWNFTQSTITFPIRHAVGWHTYSLLDDEFHEKHGLLTYRIQIITEDQEVFKDWKHQLWVNLIELDEKKPSKPVKIEEEPLPKLDTFNQDEYAERTPIPEEFSTDSMTAWAERINSSVEDQSKQGSVIETPTLSVDSEDTD